jgi:hypothetical protein
MDQQTTLLASVVPLAALATLGSYYLYQWLASGGWKSPLPWFACGLAIVVLAVGLFALIVQLTPLSLLNREELPSNRIGSPRSSMMQPESHSDPANQQSAARASRTEFRHQAGSTTSASVRIQRQMQTAQLNTADMAAQASDPSRTLAVEHYAWLEDRSFWGATKCVLAVRQDPEDARTWILINDCQADVRILVTTCDSPAEYCYQRGSRNWSYVRGGTYLPSKVKRSISAEEQTVHGLHLRYAACRVNPPATTEQHPDESGALRRVGIQDCTEEVRSLAAVGAQSGSRLEELVNEPVPDNPCCQPKFGP